MAASKKEQAEAQLEAIREQVRESWNQNAGNWCLVFP
jgi:hypothetical protein